MSKNLPRIQVIDGVKTLKFSALCGMLSNEVHVPNDLRNEYKGRFLVKTGTENLKLNGINREIDPDKDKFIHMIFWNRDSDNIEKYGMSYIKEDGYEGFIRPVETLSLIPAVLFENKKEGDEFIIRLTTLPYYQFEDRESEITLEMRICLAQEYVGFRDFEKFEDLYLSTILE